MHDDAELLRRYIDEYSEEAFAELVRKHIDIVYGSAMRRLGGNRHAAEDVVQIVFTALARKAHSVARHPSLEGWLHKSTRFAAIDWLRDQSRRERHETMSDDMEQYGRTEEPVEDWARLEPVIDSVLDRLSDSDRAAVMMRYVSNKPWAEIASTLHISEDAARKRTERALSHMRSSLKRIGLTSSAAVLTAALSHTCMAAPAGLAASVATASLSASASGTGIAASAIALAKAKAGLVSIALAVPGIVAVGVFGTAYIRERNEVQRLQASAANTPEGAGPSMIGEIDALKQRSAALDRARQRELDLIASLERARAAGARRIAIQRALSEDPVYTQLQKREDRLRAYRIYGDFLATCGLPRRKIDEVIDLLAERFRIAREQNLAISRQTVGTSPSSLAGDLDGLSFEPSPHPSAELDQLRERLREALGDGLYQGLRDAERRRAADARADRVAMQLSERGLPLAADQHAALRIFFEEKPNPMDTCFLQPEEPDPQAQSQPGGPDTKRLSAILSANQLQALAEHREQKLHDTAVRTRLTAGILQTYRQTIIP